MENEEILQRAQNALRSGKLSPDEAKMAEQVIAKLGGNATPAPAADEYMKPLPLPTEAEDDEEGDTAKFARVAADSFVPFANSVAEGYKNNPERALMMAAGGDFPMPALSEEEAKGFDRDWEAGKQKLAEADASLPWYVTAPTKMAGFIFGGPGKVIKAADKAGDAARVVASAAMGGAKGAAGANARGADAMETAKQGFAGSVAGAVGGMLPMGKAPIMTPVMGAAGGAAAERAGRLAYEQRMDALWEEPMEALKAGATGAALPLMSYAGRRGREAIRGPGRESGQDIAAFEKAGGKLGVVKHTPPPGTPNLPHPVQKVAADAAKTAIEGNYKRDVASYKSFRDEEAALMTREKARKPLPVAVKIGLRNAIQKRIDALYDDQGQILSEMEPLRDKLVSIRDYVAKPIEKVVKGTRKETREKVDDYYGTKTTEEVDVPFSETKRVSRKLTLGSLVKLRRDLDEIGNVGGTNNDPGKQVIKGLAKEVRELLGNADPDGMGLLFKRENESLTKAERRNRQLGVSKKAKFNPETDPKKAETVAGRLASTRGTDNKAAARRKNVIEAAKASGVGKEVPRIEGLQAYENLKFDGSPIDIGIYGGRQGNVSPRTFLRNLTGSPTLSRVDAGIDWAQNRTAAPPAIMWLMSQPTRKPKKQKEDQE